MNATTFISKVAEHYADLDISLVKHNLKQIPDNITRMDIDFAQDINSNKGYMVMNRLTFNSEEKQCWFCTLEDSRVIQTEDELDKTLEALKRLTFKMVDTIHVDIKL